MVAVVTGAACPPYTKNVQKNVGISIPGKQISIPAYVERLGLLLVADPGHFSITGLVADAAGCMQVPAAYVERLDLVPDIDLGVLNIMVHGNAAAKGLKVSSHSTPAVLSFLVVCTCIVLSRMILKDVRQISYRCVALNQHVVAAHPGYTARWKGYCCLRK